MSLMTPRNPKSRGPSTVRPAAPASLVDATAQSSHRDGADIENAPPCGTPKVQPTRSTAVPPSWAVLPHKPPAPPVRVFSEGMKHGIFPTTSPRSGKVHATGAPGRALRSNPLPIAAISLDEQRDPEDSDRSFRATETLDVKPAAEVRDPEPDSSRDIGDPRGEPEAFAFETIPVPVRLWHMVNHTAHRNPRLISWTADGGGFVFHQTDRLMAVLRAHAFTRAHKFHSFHRLLNGFGFVVTKEAGRPKSKCFRHSTGAFHRHASLLELTSIQGRVRVSQSRSGKQKRGAPRSVTEPAGAPPSSPPLDLDPFPLDEPEDWDALATATEALTPRIFDEIHALDSSAARKPSVTTTRPRDGPCTTPHGGSRAMSVMATPFESPGGTKSNELPRNVTYHAADEEENMLVQGNDDEFVAFENFDDADSILGAFDASFK